MRKERLSWAIYPGRCFTSELGIMLEYILLNCNFFIDHERPRDICFGNDHLPPTEATIKVRRRRNGS